MSLFRMLVFMILIAFRIDITFSNTITSDNSLFLINYGHLKSDTKYIRQKEENKLKDALESVGFFAITNHNINHQIMDSAWNDSVLFFETNSENKNSVKMTKEYIYGYQNKEILSKSEKTNNKNKQIDINSFDQKETFQVLIGAENSNRYSDVLWPLLPHNMNVSFVNYYRELEILMDGLLESIAVILNLSKNFFAEYNNDHLTALRVANYPHISVDSISNTYRCSPHTDWTLLTLLRQDIVGGLQIENNNKWIDIVTDFYDFVVNIGDLMEIWTNNRFKSTRHRVVNYYNNKIYGNDIISNRRQAMAFFYFPNGDTIIDPRNISSTCTDTTEIEYKPVNVNQYLETKHASTQFYDSGKTNY